MISLVGQVIMKEPVKNKIVERLTEEFNPDFLEDINESASH